MIALRRVLILAAIPLILSACGIAGADNNQPDAGQAPTGEQQGRPRRPYRKIDFAVAAQKLGVTEAQLKQALGVPENPPENPTTAPNGTRRRTRPDLKAAATKLGVTEEKLRDALGIPARRPDGSAPSNQPTSQS